MQNPRHQKRPGQSKNSNYHHLIPNKFALNPQLFHQTTPHTHQSHADLPHHLEVRLSVLDTPQVYLIQVQFFALFCSVFQPNSQNLLENTRHIYLVEGDEAKKGILLFFFVLGLHLTRADFLLLHSSYEKENIDLRPSNTYELHQ